MISALVEGDAARMNAMVAEYMNQDSSQTLREGLAEYYRLNQGLLDPEGLPEGADIMFRRHDAGHVVFGCDTSLRGETLIDTWTIVGSSAGLRGYVEYFKYPQVNQIFEEVGYFKIALESLRCIPDVLRLIANSFKMTSRWPWGDYEPYLDRPLDEIRNEFNIRVV